MKNKHPVTLAIAAALALPALSFAKEYGEKEVKSSDVPAAVQKAADSEAKGGKIVRWEKEGNNYEAVIEKDGKQMGVQFDANGKVKGKHDEAKEKGEKGEKH